MMSTYLSIQPEKGMWYLSEGFLSRTNPGNSPDDMLEYEKMLKHNQGAHRMIVAGPFKTREDAEVEQLKYPDPGSLDLWQRNLSTC